MRLSNTRRLLDYIEGLLDLAADPTGKRKLRTPALNLLLRGLSLGRGLAR